MKTQVVQLNGSQPKIELPYQCKIIVEGGNRRSGAFPCLVYMPEKDRLLLSITSWDYEMTGTEQPLLMHSDDHGDTWSEPRPAYAGSKELKGNGGMLTYLGGGKLLIHCPGPGSPPSPSWAWWISRDFGEQWELQSADPGYGGWDPLFPDFDPSTGQLRRVLYGYWRPTTEIYSGGHARFQVSLDEGRTWEPEVVPPQWLGGGEPTFARAANGDLVAAIRTGNPRKFHGQQDGYCGLGVSISKDDGRTWSDFNMLYEWGRHHPSVVRLSTGELVMSYIVRRGYPDTPDGQFYQFGEEAVVSCDHGQTWDLDHRYILCTYHGSINRREVAAAEADPHNTSSVVLPNDEIVTVFGIGPRSLHHWYPRDVGMVRWRISRQGLNNERTISDAPFDSDLRNKFDINPPSRPTPGRTNLVTSRLGAETSASECLAGPEFLLYDPYLFTELVAFFTNPAWVEVRWPDVHKFDEIILEGRGLGSLLPPGADQAQDGYRVQLHQGGEWRDFTDFTEASKTPTWLPGYELLHSWYQGRDQEFRHVLRFEPVLAKGTRLQWSFPHLDTAAEKRPYLIHLEIMGWG